jgi:CRP-like cAMP-binding protein
MRQPTQPPHHTPHTNTHAGKPRAATVVCQSRGTLWRLSRHDFRAAVQRGRADPGQLLLRCLKVGGV